MLASRKAHVPRIGPPPPRSRAPADSGAGTARLPTPAMEPAARFEERDHDRFARRTPSPWAIQPPNYGLRGAGRY